MPSRRTKTAATILTVWITLTLVSLLIGSCHAAEKPSPGFVVVPRPLERAKASRLIQITNSTWRDYVKQMDDFLLPYQQQQMQSPNSYSRCSWTSSPDRPEKSCSVGVGRTGSSKFCNKALNYGYDAGRPCFFLMLDKLENWKPEPYTSSDTADPKLPAPVRDTMEKTVIQQGGHDDLYVWINCEGEQAFDKEELGPMNYSPLKGVPTYYFPYQRSQQSTYLSPFVTLHLHGVTQKAALNVVCRAYAKNLAQDVDKSLAAIHFQLLIDFSASGRSAPDDGIDDEHRWPDAVDAEKAETTTTTVNGTTDAIPNFNMTEQH